MPALNILLTYLFVHNTFSSRHSQAHRCRASGITDRMLFSQVLNLRTTWEAAVPRLRALHLQPLTIRPASLH